MTVTMKRIAVELGVSITTVSKVVNNHVDISADTRARVLARIEELGYRPNAVARSLTLRRSSTIGVVIPDLMHSFFVEVIAGMEPVFSARGFGMLLCSSGEDARKERAEISLLRQRQVDGIAIASTSAAGNTDVLSQLVAHGTALVMFDRDDHPGVRCDRVLTDDERVGKIATEHLIGAGRRAIAHITGPRIVHARRRERGYRQALRAHGMKLRPELVVRGGFMEADGYRAMKRLLALRPRADAVFAANDPAAIGAMKAIWNSGLRVPEDVAVVGVGNIAHGDLLRVPLTTVSWSRAEQGRQSAELLLDRIGPKPSARYRHVTIPPQLVVRESCGGARPAAQTRREATK